MTDDIVTQLRYIYSQKDVGVSVNPETFTEAADEIERLRQLLMRMAQYCDDAVSRASECLGSPHSMWGAINDLSTMSDVAQNAVNGNWDYDPYEWIE